MKKRIILIFLILNTGILAGQSIADYIMKSRALIESGKPDEAALVLTDAAQRIQDFRLFVERAESYLQKGDYPQAINDFNSANSINAGSGEFGLARVYAIRGNASTAVYHLELCLKSSFKKSEKEVLLDPSFSTIENSPEWRQFWKKDWYDNYEKAISEIEYDVTTGNISDAKGVLNDLAGAYSERNGNIYAAALISFAEGKYPESVKALTGLLNEEASNEKYLRLLAKAQEAGGNTAGASSTYSRLLDLEIPDAGLLLSRAECYKKTGETDKAVSDVEKYLSFYPDNKKALSFAGKIESESGDNIKALEYFSRNLKLHPNDADCYADRANSYFMARSWDLAVKDYSMSLDLRPDNPDVWLNKGIALLSSGKTDDACHDFRMAFNQGSRKATEYLSRSCIR
jgi:tetratricopeptide (TPR) repeat protein